MLSRRPARIAAAALLLAPAPAGAAWATTGTPPLAMRVAPTAVTRLGIEVTNAGAVALAPHFTLTSGQGMSQYWTVVRGPVVLPARASARYELRPPAGRGALPRPGARVRLRAFTAVPQTLSSADVRLRSSG
ncbi:hypothetical protein [Streptomyces chartreusis]